MARALPGPSARPRSAFAPQATSSMNSKYLHADLLDCGLPGRDAAGIDIDEVVPLLGQRGARGDLHYGDHGKAVRRTFAGGEDVQVHRGQLLRAANEIAGGSRGENEAFCFDLFAVGQLPP